MIQTEIPNTLLEISLLLAFGVFVLYRGLLVVSFDCDSVPGTVAVASEVASGWSEDGA